MSFPNHWTDYGSGPIDEGELIAFTGHRPDKLGGYSWSPIQELVCRAIRWKLTKLKPRGIISGMALGVDQWAAQIAVELGIPFAAYVPFEGQESVWPPESQAAYRFLLSKAERTCICSLGGYSAKKMQWRNIAMVDDSDLLFAVWDGSDGGTANCVKYAWEISKQKYTDGTARQRVIRYNPRP